MFEITALRKKENNDWEIRLLGGPEGLMASRGLELMVAHICELIHNSILWAVSYTVLMIAHESCMPLCVCACGNLGLGFCRESVMEAQWGKRIEDVGKKVTKMKDHIG